MYFFVNRNPSLIQYLPAGHVIGKPEPLFSKIEPDVLEKLKAKYAGTQDDREKKVTIGISCIFIPMAYCEL